MLTGSIPSELGLIPDTHCSFSSNQLTGSLPTELGLMRDLPWVHENSLTGTLPTGNFLNRSVLGTRYDLPLFLLFFCFLSKYRWLRLYTELQNMPNLTKVSTLYFGFMVPSDDAFWLPLLISLVEELTVALLSYLVTSCTFIQTT